MLEFILFAGGFLIGFGIAYKMAFRAGAYWAARYTNTGMVQFMNSLSMADKVHFGNLIKAHNETILKQRAKMNFSKKPKLSIVPNSK